MTKSGDWIMARCLTKGTFAFWLLAVLSSVAVAQTPGGMMPPMSMPSLPGYQGHELHENMVVPQFAVGEHYTTSLFLFNMVNMTQMPWVTAQALHLTGEVYFYHQDGTPLQVGVNGSNPVSNYAFTLSASESISLEMSSSGVDTSGWAMIAVDDNGTSSWGMMDGQQMMRANRIMATAYYTYKDGGQVISRAGVIPSIYEMQRYFTSITPVQLQDGIDSGLAIVNTSAQTVTVQLSLENANGEVIATRQIPLTAGNQIARFIDDPQLFGGFISGSFRGFVEIDTSSDGIVALGLLMTGGIMTSIPTQHHGAFSMM
jgi:hypothetical protein